MKFTTTIQGSDTKAGIEVPEEIVRALGAGRRPPVVVTINGRSYRSSIAVMGGQNMVGVSAANRELTGTAAGDTVEVDIALDTLPRVIDVPEDLAAALDAEPQAKAFYATLNYSAQRRYVEPIADAKTAETRSRRIAKIVTDLKAGKK
ncbi:YdeI/OmpD-associated family protein [Arthrobacter sp. 2YAF22_2]|uniref:YdeI/OmpD-associated family protein n=1 Tax=Arthrobacter sp. 2YAF22_2 TaxID=3233029 RepID=UPI003F8E2D82